MDRRGDAKSREMMLDELLGYDHVTIQCHDNPDADAIASGYGLYCFFRDKGKDTRLLYSGRNKVRKANLMLMVEKLHIPCCLIFSFSAFSSARVFCFGIV